jgi:UDP-N-acetylglucosamine--N-acetylmuramyl-(pentapeptide) pyrophosphoryl-undecaprenol N-acetylglucosamine transferase
MKVIMTGGGTGGHIYPAIAIADEIKKRFPDADILFVGAERGLEKTLVPDNGYPIELITVQGFNRKKLLKNIEVARQLQKANKRSKEIIKEFQPDVVIGTGGYASAPVVKMAQELGIPTYIHEQNAFPGITNKMLEKKVTKLFMGFEEASQYFKQPEKHITAGNPVRANFLTTSKESARKELGYKDNEFVLLAFGGSQGAGRINKAMLKVIEALNGAEDFRICLATGRFYYDAILEELENMEIELKDNVQIMEYISDMDKYLAASDLVISRSGALTIAEVTVCGKPAIFIPSPHVTGNHQFFNARAVAEKGGAIVIEEKDLDNDKLIARIISLQKDPEALEDMAQKSHKCAPMDAVGIICDNIEEFNQK